MPCSFSTHSLCQAVRRLRHAAPLVHNITNYVVMQTTANALLALGASPVMAHAVEEVEDITCISQSLVINIGTLSSHWMQAAEKSMHCAFAHAIPVVFDPVGVGASQYRLTTSQHLLAGTQGVIIRGNASEILTLAGAGACSKGVDSGDATLQAHDAAKDLAAQYSTTVCISGAVDIITDGTASVFVYGGSPLMPQVTGMGCTASALVGAFAAVCPSAFEATLSAMLVMSVCGQKAASTALGTGSFAVNFLDALSTLSDADIIQYAAFDVAPKNR